MNAEALHSFDSLAEMFEPAESTLDELHDRMFRYLHNTFYECENNNGRFWVVHVPSVYARMVLRTQNLTDTATGHMAVLANSNGISPSICSPAACGIEQTLAWVVPDFVAHSHGGAGLSLPAIRPSMASSDELGHWEHLDLDFVIAGMDRCGSTSLREGLAQHPEIGFRQLNRHGRPLEDYWPGFVRRQNLLPLRRDVEEFNSAWTKSGRVPPRVKGTANPLIYRTRSSYRALASLPGLRMVLVMCDPVGKFESTFFRDVWCHPDEAQAHANGDFRLSGRSMNGDCLRTISPGVIAPESAGNGTRLRIRDAILDASHLGRLRGLFGQRMLALHVSEMHRHPARFFDRVAKFVGTKASFSPGTPFRHYNRRKGHRTDLCHNASGLKEITSLLEPVYAAMERSLSESDSEVPGAHLRRQTRCAIPEELTPHPPDGSEFLAADAAGNS